MSIRTPFRARLCAGVLTLAAVLAAAPAASADPVADPTLCDEPMTQPFTPWGDDNWYALAPQGDFEGELTAWSLAGGAQQVPGSEPFGVTGTVGASSLALPEGAVAESPEVCIDATRETLRFFVRSATPRAKLTVDAVFLNARDQSLATFRVGKVRPSGAEWAPSPVLANPVVQVLQNVARAVDGRASVVYRFTAHRGGVQIDDLLIDPRWNR